MKTLQDSSQRDDAKLQALQVSCLLLRHSAGNSLPVRHAHVFLSLQFLCGLPSEDLHEALRGDDASVHLREQHAGSYFPVSSQTAATAKANA